MAQFERAYVDVTGIEDWGELAALIGRSLEQVRHGIASEHMVARLHFTGETPLAWRIRRDIDLLTAEAQDRASVIGGCWVEKLETSCQTPSAGNEGSSDPLLELRGLITDGVIGSDAFRAELVTMADELRRKLPGECRDIFGSDEESFKDSLALLAQEGMEDVLARLHAGEKGSSDKGSKLATEMSKGTRFQLYLALRVAGYFEFARTRSPVPFIADDIMETFDDFRAEEAFRLFAEMATTGQVIYLTHHQHLCEIAHQVCPTVTVHSLPETMTK